MDANYTEVPGSTTLEIGFRESKPYLDTIYSHFTGAACLFQPFPSITSLIMGSQADSSVSNQTSGPYIGSLVSDFYTCTKMHLLISPDSLCLHLRSDCHFCFIFFTLGKNMPVSYILQNQTEKTGSLRSYTPKAVHILLRP